MAVNVLQGRRALCTVRLVRCARFSSGASSSKVDDLKPVETWSEGKVRLIALNRPAQRNAVNRNAAKLLFRAFKEFNRDKSVDSAVLFGKGGNFCAGYDLKELAGSDSHGNAMEVLLESQQGDPQQMENIPSPMVLYNTHMTCVWKHTHNDMAHTH